MTSEQNCDIDNNEETTIQIERELPEDIVSIRRSFEDLTHEESIDKISALKIMKLQHSMENVFLKLQYEKDREIDALKNALKIIEITQQYTTEQKRHRDTISSLESERDILSRTLEQQQLQHNRKR